MKVECETTKKGKRRKLWWKAFLKMRNFRRASPPVVEANSSCHVVLRYVSRVSALSAQPGMSRTVVVFCVFSTIFRKLKRNLKLDDARTFPLVRISTLFCGLAGGRLLGNRRRVPMFLFPSPQATPCHSTYFATFELWEDSGRNFLPQKVRMWTWNWISPNRLSECVIDFQISLPPESFVLITDNCVRACELLRRRQDTNRSTRHPR